jgi:hypothetical protein
MRCIICHNDGTPLEVLVMCSRCKKGLITHHKSSGITTLKKHVDFGHSILLNKLLEDTTNIAPRFPLNHEPNQKKAHVCQITTSNLFFNDTTHVGFLEDLMLFVVKGLLPIRIF